MVDAGRQVRRCCAIVVRIIDFRRQNRTHLSQIILRNHNWSIYHKAILCNMQKEPLTPLGSQNLKTPPEILCRPVNFQAFNNRALWCQNSLNKLKIVAILRPPLVPTYAEATLVHLLGSQSFKTSLKTARLSFFRHSTIVNYGARTLRIC